MFIPAQDLGDLFGGDVGMYVFFFSNLVHSPPVRGVTPKASRHAHLLKSVNYEFKTQYLSLALELIFLNPKFCICSFSNKHPLSVPLYWAQPLTTTMGICPKSKN